MPKTPLLLLPWLLIFSACATPVPVAVSCPPPDPLPEVLTQFPSKGPSLSERYELLIQELRDSLQKAIKPE